MRKMAIKIAAEINLGSIKVAKAVGTRSIGVDSSEVRNGMRRFLDRIFMKT